MIQENSTCFCCSDEISNNSLSCLNNHKLCDDCLNNQINSQINPANVGAFVKNDCKIICGFCKIPFNDRTILAKLSDEQYQSLCKIREDVIISKTEAECNKKNLENGKKSQIDVHRMFICEKILTLHCKRCDSAILDFEGCFAIECNKCKASMCGWCLDDFSPDAHQHVKHCKHSLNKGSVYGKLEQFNQVHQKKRQNKVKKYLDSIYLQDERDAVKLAVKKDLEDLGINLNESEPNIVVKKQKKEEAEEQLLEDIRRTNVWQEFIREQQTPHVNDNIYYNNIYYNYYNKNIINDNVYYNVINNNMHNNIIKKYKN